MGAWLFMLGCLGVPLWTLGTSLFVLVGSRDRMRAAAAAA